MNRLVQGLTVGAGVNWQSRIYTKHATYGEYGQKSLHFSEFDGSLSI
ncbi:Uncharacterised protein [Mannheimia haemolytica]|uniref:Uncharacterized protein n=1 Tax=Mannheimia haemolytica TaxID=75985 RepID=A0A378N3I7_MANHA|nr:Uncharacterised protein [Mannheimia haemolytica]